MPSWNLASLVESIRVHRFRWPLVVLLASIGLTGLAAIEAQRTGRSQAAVSERALREYASFAVWSYAQHLADTLNIIEREAIGAVNHGNNMHSNPQVPPAKSLAHYLPWDDACQCHHARIGPEPEAFLAIKIGSNDVDIGVNTHPDAEGGWEVDRPMSMSIPMPVMNNRLSSSGEQRWLLDSLVRRIRHLGETDHGFSLVIANVDNRTRIFAYTLMPTSWGDTMVYVARYSKASFVRLLEGVLDGNGLLPATFTEGRRNRDVLSLRVRDSEGNLLFDSSPGNGTAHASSPLNAKAELPDRAGQLKVDATIRPELAGALLIGGLPTSRLPFLFGLLGLAAALSIVAVTQLRREGELAHLRAGFVSSVSHELRTPVAQIRLYLETLQLGRASTEEQKRWSLGHIDRETKRLSHLVENVLRFQTLGRADHTQRDPVDVGTEVANIAQEFAGIAASRKNTVVVDAMPTTPIAMSPDALRHIVLNLLDNATKYGPAGQTIRVSVRSVDNGGVSITVEDEGPGVAAGDRERIWRPFTRGSTTLANGGSGIGLTIVREVAGAHGGTAHVESSASGGARFVVTLR
jgi:signal transduction histidine kinase